MSLPVPCPSCGGLVNRQTLKCSRCGGEWDTLTELLFDGLCGTSERMASVAECGDWTNPLQVTGDIMNLFSLNSKYHLEIERMERR